MYDGCPAARTERRQGYVGSACWELITCMAAWTDVVSSFAEAARCCARRVPDADEVGGEFGVPGAPARGQRESAWARGGRVEF